MTFGETPKAEIHNKNDIEGGKVKRRGENHQTLLQQKKKGQRGNAEKKEVISNCVLSETQVKGG